MARTVFVAASFAFCLTAANCGQSPTSPSVDAIHFLQEGSTLSGTVFETTPAGPRALHGDVGVSVTYLGSRLERTIDSAGRYTVSHLDEGARASLEVYGVNAFDGHQPCAATAVIHGDTVLDVEFNPLHVPGSGGSPHLSGIVSITIGSLREPLRNMRVQYRDAGAIVAYTFTDEEGRYALCRLPTGTGRLEVTDASPWDYGGPYAQLIVNVSGDASLDVEIER